MDNGYKRWKIKKQNQKRKRITLILKMEIPFSILSIFVFIFGYDAPMFDKTKIIEFSCAYIGMMLIIVIISIIKYKINKYVPSCNKCGHEIKRLTKDCVTGKIEYLGTIDKTIYEKVNSRVKKETVYPRGGYSMRNSTMEKTSESTFEINQEIPVVKRFHVYNIEYRCKICNELYCYQTKETLKPLNINQK